MLNNINIPDYINPNTKLDLENFTFFWNGPFSQWHKSEFTVDGLTFNTAEQFMMLNKAILFKDYQIADEIMKSKNPRQQKALGRQVAGFKQDKWEEICDDVVYTGNYHKFMQNPDLKQILLDTGTTTLVEASPHDTIWGIGLDEARASITPYTEWKGLNKLGLILTILRNSMAEYDSVLFDYLAAQAQQQETVE